MFHWVSFYGIYTLLLEGVTQDKVKTEKPITERENYHSVYSKIEMRTNKKHKIRTYKSNANNLV